jgi:nucleoside-diphosphate-sugar epimerase
MKVLVTGGCGYIGIWLVRKLREAGHEVRVIDKCLFPTGLSAVQEWAPGAEVLRADIRALPDGAFKGVDAVCHLAGLSNDPTADFAPDANYAMNTEATLAIGEAAKAAGVRRVTFASSASVYGYAHRIGLTEDAALEPASHYAESKALAEDALLALADATFEPIIMRQGTVGGWSPRMRWDLVVNTMVKCALTRGEIRVFAGGEAYRPLIDVEDVAEAHLRFIESDCASGIYNVAKRRSVCGNAEPLAEGYTVGCLALYVAHLLEGEGLTVRVRGDWTRSEGRSYDLDCTKMRAALEWEPTRGVAAMVSGVLQHAENLDDPQTRNIDWMKALDYGQQIAEEFGQVF